MSVRIIYFYELKKKVDMCYNYVIIAVIICKQKNMKDIK